MLLVIKPNLLIAILHLALLSLVFGTSGCTRVYQTAMEEMNKSDHERLAARVDSLRAGSVQVREAVKQSEERFQIAQTMTDESRLAQELIALDVSIQRLELHVWNLRRYTKSVRDVGEDQIRHRTDAPSLIGDRYLALLHESELAHEAARQAIETLDLQSRALAAASSDAVTPDVGRPRSLMAGSEQTMPTAIERIDDVIRSADAFLEALPHTEARAAPARVMW